jgi:probable Rubsico expression protein CbbX
VSRADEMRFGDAPPPRTDGPRTDGPRTDGPRTDGAGTNGVAEEEGAPPEPLSSDVDEERRSTAIDEILDGLDRELVGLAPVKTRIREISALLLVDRLRRRFGIESSRPTLHMCFTGGPGTGKTTVALRMAKLLKGLGYLQKGHLVSVTRDEMVGQYIGHTAPKTKEVLTRALGGVLFIDEAYYLHRPENERDYGQEAIEILLQVMENQREDLVVILAGYKDRMDEFFASNPGMSSRIAHHIDFPDYTLDELCAIGDLMLDQQSYEFTPETRDMFRHYLDRRREQPRFANARSVRNALERARLRQANRLVTAGVPVGRSDLLRIEPEDFLASRVLAPTTKAE